MAEITPTVPPVEPTVMGRPASKDRTERVTTVLSAEELAHLDEDRGPLDRSKFVRYIIRRAHKEGIHFRDA